MRLRIVPLVFAVAVALHGQQVEAFFDSAARELPCVDNGCIWSLERLLTYYGIGLDKEGLRIGLLDFRADVRSMAAAKLGKDRLKAAIPWLADALLTESAIGTRVFIANALAELGDNRGLVALKSLCNRVSDSDTIADAWVSIEATSELLRFHDTGCNDAIIDALHLLEHPHIGKDPLVPNLMSVGLSVANLLDSPSENQVGAIREIAERCILHRDMGVRQFASMALALYGNTVSYQKLRSALAVETDSMVRAVMEREVRRMESNP